MSDVIDLLEKMGQDAQWRGASPAVIETALNEAGVASDLRAAIVAEDQDGLQALLGISPICGMYLPGKDDEKEEDDTEELPPGEDGDEPEKNPSQLQSVGQ